MLMSAHLYWLYLFKFVSFEQKFSLRCACNQEHVISNFVVNSGNQILPDVDCRGARVNSDNQILPNEDCRGARDDQTLPDLEVLLIDPWNFHP